jgi:transcription-repair coupling factor (superfamily II helicase)
LVAAAIAAHAPQTLLVVLPHAAQTDVCRDELALFTTADAATLPAWESSRSEHLVHDELRAARIRLLKRLAARGGDPTPSHHPRVIVTSIQALMQPVPSRGELAAATRRIAVGESLDVQELAQWMVARGLEHTTAVELPGEFAVRGGIVDVFPADALDPIRVELFGDEVESIRVFDAATQRSRSEASSCEVTALSPEVRPRAHLAEYLPAESWLMLCEPTELVEEGGYYHRRLEDPNEAFATSVALAEMARLPTLNVAAVPAGGGDEVVHLRFESVERFSGDPARVRDELQAAAAEQHVYLICETDAEIQRLGELFDQTPVAAEGRLHLTLGRLASGFRLAQRQVILVSAAELFGRHDLARPKVRQTGRAIDSFLDLREGDLVVHLAHGIGRYRGLKLLEKEGRAEEHLELEFHGGTRIFVPSSKVDLVQKYVGGRKAKPILSRIGGKSWIRQKEAARQAVTDLAAEMLQLQAAREARPGIAFPPDTSWQREFDAEFPYVETDDQLAAIDAIKHDMQLSKPMDRLLCGDVGFGKTEVAMRAAFKAIDSGYQVALLAPTTVLAEQHRRTFTQRMAEFPFEIAAVSRFCRPAEQRDILRRTALGQVDLLIGTHRLASPDVQFANLGLVIIDEEQRFGVTVKERLKALRASVDVLTMTATPIPRTLHLSLLGVRSISNLESPPKDRLAVETRIARFDAALIRQAVLREINREGQIYFVHNRVHDIQAVAQKLAEIVPEARIAIGHGQMADGELEEVMLGFVRHDFDLLLATTIVESGLDIPNANTIFIDDADRYGLADLHQLRGRVGRYKHRAYCYLMIDPDRRLTPEAARRLRAIEEFSEMGAGFALAMRDLELRGAGNLLGSQQSGHIATVGYELYCSLLENAVRQLRKLPPRETVDAAVDLPLDAFFPRDYVEDMRTKIDLYRRLARISAEAELEEWTIELVDRFGALPAPVQQLAELARIRIWAHRAQISAIHLEDRYLVLTAADNRPLAALRALHGDDLRIADATSGYLPLPGLVREGQAVDAEGVVEVVKSLLRPAAGGL